MSERTTPDDDDAPSTTPAADTATTTANGPVWTGRRWARPAAAGVGLLLVGGLGGFAVGHAGGGDDRLAPTSFQPGQRGGPGPGGASGQQGGPGSGGTRMTPPQGGTQEAPSGQPGQSDGSTGSGDSTT